MATTPQARTTGRSEYLKKILGPAVSAGEAPDVFTRYELELSENDPQVIAQQIDAVHKIWRTSIDHEKYGELVRRLLKEHPEAEKTLKDPTRRQAAREDVLRAKRTQERAGLEQFETLIAELRDRTGALPESTRSRLIEVGAGLGLADSEVAARLARERFVDDIGATRQVLDEAKFKPIGSQLSALRGQLHADEVGPTLFSFIGAPFSASREQLRSAYSTAMGSNDKRPFGDAKTLANRVLVDVRRYLVEGDPDLYRNALVQETKNALRERMQHRKTLHGSLDTKAFQSFVADAVRRGLDEKWANTAVRELAREERLAIDADGARPTTTPVPPVAPIRPTSGPVPPVPPPRPSSGPVPPVPPPRPSSGPVPPVPPPRPPIPPARPPGPQPPVRPPIPPRPNSGAMPPTRSAQPGPLLRGIQQQAFRCAPYWWTPALIPLVGASLSWFLASAGARRGRYFWYAIGWWVLVGAAASGKSNVLDAVWLALVWIVSLVHVLRRRDAVRDEIRTRSTG